MVLYVLVEPTYDPYYVELNLRELNQHYKPLLSTVVQLNMLLFYPLAHLLYKGHYAFAGRQIVRLLDDATTGVLDQFFICHRPHCRLLIVQAVVLLLLLTTYIFLDSDILLLTLAGEEGPISSNNLTGKCLKVLTTFSVYADMFFTYGIVLIFKLAMRQRLCQMVKQINSQLSGNRKISEQGLMNNFC